MNYIYCWKLCLVNVTHVSLCEMWRRPEPLLALALSLQPTAVGHTAGQT